MKTVWRYVINVGFIVISVVIALDPPTFIAQLMGISWGALAGAFLAPFLYGLYWKRATALSVWVCMIFSSVVMLVNMFFKSWFPPLLQSPINAGVFCMLAGLVLVPVVSLCSKPPRKDHVEQVFSCYDRTVVVSVTDSIGDNVK